MVQELQQSVHFMAVIETWQKDRDWRDLLWAQLQFQNSVSQHSVAQEHRPGNTHTTRTSSVASSVNQTWNIILDRKKMHHLVSPIENFAVVQNLLQIFSIPFQQSNQLLEVDLEMFSGRPNQPKRDHVFPNVSIISRRQQWEFHNTSLQ